MTPNRHTKAALARVAALAQKRLPAETDTNAAKADALRAAHGITPEQEAEARRLIADERRDQTDKTAVGDRPEGGA